MSKHSRKHSGRTKKLYPAIEVFATGLSYAQSAESLFDKHKETNLRAFYFPYLVLQALSIEILFKSIHFDLLRSPGDLHGLKDLFERLPPAYRDRIDHHFQECVAQSPAKALRELVPEMRDLSLTLDSTLSRCSNVFTKIRYQYEQQPWDRDDEGFAAIEGQSSILNALVAFIHELHPDWIGKFESANKLSPGLILAIPRRAGEFFQLLKDNDPQPPPSQPTSAAGPLQIEGELALDYAFIAISANVRDDGIFDATGANVDWVETEVPSIWPLSLVMRFEGEGTHSVRVDLVYPDGERSNRIAEQLTLQQSPGGMMSARLVVANLIVPLRAAGTSLLEILVDGKSQKTIPFIVEPKATT